MKYPADYKFDTINRFIHHTDRYFEELQCVILGMATHIEDLEKKLNFPAGLVLTGHEIKDLAEFAGFQIVYDDYLDEMESEIEISKDSHGLLDDDGSLLYYKHIACYYEYPEEGYIGLGEEIEQERTQVADCPEVDSICG